MNLQQTIEQLYERVPAHVDKKNALRAIGELKSALNNGTVRAAEFQNGAWHVNTWVKKGILLAFRFGALSKIENGSFPFFDKETMTLKQFSMDDNVRIVPGG